MPRNTDFDGKPPLGNDSNSQQSLMDKVKRWEKGTVRLLWQ